jgi:hypothetical protein
MQIEADRSCNVGVAKSCRHVGDRHPCGYQRARVRMPQRVVRRLHAELVGEVAELEADPVRRHRLGGVVEANEILRLDPVAEL